MNATRECNPSTKRKRKPNWTDDESVSTYDCIFPVATYGHVIITLILEASALIPFVSLPKDALTKLVTNKTFSRCDRYLPLDKLCITQLVKYVSLRTKIPKWNLMVLWCGHVDTHSDYS